MSRTFKAHRHILLLLMLTTAVCTGRFSIYAEPHSHVFTHLIPLAAEAASRQFIDPELGMEEDIDKEMDEDIITEPYEENGEMLFGQSYKRPEPNDSNRNWWYLLRHGKLNTADTTVQYPKFLGFCMKVYRWADKTFNSYDTTYVVGTGRRWKVRILSDNWLDSYSLNPGKKLPIRIMSDPYYNVGAYIQYMAVSVGYSVDINNLFGNDPANHKKLEYTFNCARFNIEGHYWKNKAGTYIRSLGGYNDGKLIKEAFEGVRLNEFEVCGYYFFNNRKFSMGAAYNFSKFQRKSAGSPIIGLAYNNLDVSIDLTKMPEDLKLYLQIPAEPYKFHYRSYSLVGGYTFNWVITPKLLFNIGAIPGIGLNITYEDSHAGSAKTLAINIRGMASLTYNLKDFFVCAVAKLDGNYYTSSKSSLFSSVENAQLSVGYRF